MRLAVWIVRRTVPALMLAGACGAGEKVGEPSAELPKVTATTPANGATGVALDATISATFSVATAASWIELAPVISATIQRSGTSVAITPVEPLALNTRYTATAFASNDAGDIVLTSPWSFTTRPGVPAIFANVSVGNTQACGLTDAGVGFCWGNELTGSPQSAPVRVAGSTPFASIVVGNRETCALTAARAAYCWGLNVWGELGDGTTISRAAPVAVVGGLAFATVSLGDVHTCGVTVTSSAYCWGFNPSGQLGDGTTIERHTPTPVSGDLKFSTVSAGGSHTCALTTAGAAYCWGSNSFGQLGDGTVGTRWAPARVAGGLTFTAIEAGGFHTCGLTAAGEAYCWGYNAYGQLGDGITNNRLHPVPVQSTVRFAALALGFSHSCGLTTAGTAYCWGINENQLAIGAAYGPERCGSPFTGQTPCSTVPVGVTGGLTFATIAAGGARTCARTSDGATYCWERSAFQQVRDGAWVTPQTPTRVVQ